MVNLVVYLAEIVVAGALGAAIGTSVVMRRFRAEFWRVRMAVYDLFSHMDDRIGDLEHALRDAGVAIPTGRSAREKQERIAEGKRMLGFPDD